MYGRYAELTGGDAHGGDEQRYELCAALIFSNGLSGHTSYYGLPGSGGLPRWCRRLVLVADGWSDAFHYSTILVFYDMNK